ncbi:MAG: hypothetical protein C4534_03810 [Gaiellales bacterium]|nr:MAG: hypothetical protein C4534_03810 [Gaiellales bacterium]
MEGSAPAKSSKNKVYAVGVIVFLGILSALYYVSAPVYLYIVVYMWFGFLYGALQQYGRFCFASAWRDLIMVKVPRMFVGIMVGAIVLSVISAYVFVKFPGGYHTANIGPHELVGGLLFGLGMVFAGGCATGSLYKTGEGNMISLTVLLSLSFAQAIFVALPFFDTLMKKLVYVLPANVTIANLIWGHKGPDGNYHLPDPAASDGGIGFFQHLVADSLLNTVLVAVLFMIGVYAIVVRKGFLKRRANELSANADGGEVKMGLKDDVAGFWSMISASRRTSIAAILIGIVAAIQIFTLNWMKEEYDFTNFGQVMTLTTDSGNPPPESWPAKDHASEVSSYGIMFDPGYWYITTQEAMFAAWAIEDGSGGSIDMKNNIYFGGELYEKNGQTFGYPGGNAIPKPWHSPALLLSFGLILGATFLSLWNREFKWKFPTKELFLYAVLGGTIMGIGARIALGCNIGGFYTRAAFGGPGGWIFFIGMGLGAFISAKFINYLANRKLEEMDFDIEL